ncbi:MAG: YceI family protein [Melioribacteraceae bacterium]|nr:YceI family protein [Melioribacteraceae bacterium]
MKTLKALVALLFISVSFTFAQTSWDFDKSHSKIGFSVTHLLITDVEGQFKDFEGTIISSGDDFEGAKIDFSADIASIDTDNEKRDGHLKSDDFFNAEKFPKMTFKGKSFTKTNSKNYKLVGDLTIRDVTKEVELDVKYNGTVTDPWGNTKAGFALEGVVNRFDFNLKWNSAIESGGLVVGEDVTILAKLQLIKK